MTPTFFRPLLRRTWAILWRRPWVLCFGLLAGIAGTGGFWDILLNASRSSTTTAATLRAMTGMMQGGLMGRAWYIVRMAPGTTFVLLLLFLGTLAVGLALFWLASVAHAALIDTEHKEEAGLQTTMRAGWAVGKRFGWSLLGMHLLVTFAVVLSFISIGLLTIATGAFRGIGLLLPLLGVILFVFVALLASLMRMYAANAIVLQNFSVLESFHAAWRLFREHWLLSLELAAIFFLLHMLFGIAALLASALITVPFFLLFVIAKIFALPGGVGLILVIWMVVALLVFLFMASVITAWQALAWTALFRTITQRSRADLPPALVRFAARFLKRRTYDD